jgi:hypothetical protein
MCYDLDMLLSEIIVQINKIWSSHSSELLKMEAVYSYEILVPTYQSI